MALMKVLAVHNHYLLPGGEDRVYTLESELLLSRGHTVCRRECDNHALLAMGALKRASTTLWNTELCKRYKRDFTALKPQIVHLHNTFPVISPSVYWAARASGAAVVQTLHNYRLLCPAATLCHRGQVCEKCLGKAFPWPGVVHGCYRDSRPATAVTATMLAAHRLLGTWAEKVDAYIALTEFARRKFIEGGLPAEKIAVKPNFVHPDPGPGAGGGNYALFIGRLAVEKGISTLLRAWDRLGGSIALRIIGDGPMAPDVRLAARQSESIQRLGALPHDAVLRHLANARAVIVPSTCYEGFPVTIAESFAVGTPVVAGDLGSMAEIVEHGRTGLLFRSGDAGDLAAKVEWAWSNPEQLERMRKEARAEYEAKYTAEQNYRMLMAIYERALANRR